MAKAKKHHTPVAKSPATAHQLQREIEIKLAKASDKFNLSPATIAGWREINADTRARFADAAAKSAELDKACKAIDRALVMERGLVAPPWASELFSQLKPTPATAPRPTGAGVWIKAEVIRQKAAGKIREDIRITDLARLLAKRLEAAAAADQSLRKVSWRYIKNNLPVWGLWPISMIK